jgi:putative cardiolipin synthase
MCLRIAVRPLPLVGVLVAALAGCGVLSANDGRRVSSALTSDLSGVLNRAIAPQRGAQPGLSGNQMLRGPLNAFATRMLMLPKAGRCLDLRRHIWRNDVTGLLLLDASREAADRGLRLRLDDQNTSGLDRVLAALNRHANIEVRLFNPHAGRNALALQFVSDFSRLNQRMHNKSPTADNQVTLVGGRTMGDACFGATDGVVFADLDVLAVGPVVADVSTGFDRYWAAISSYLAERLLPESAPDALAALAALAERVARAIENPAAAECVTASQQPAFVARLLPVDLPLVWASTRMASDPFFHVIADKASRQALAISLVDVIGQTTRELQIVSPHFVSTNAGVQTLQALRQRGVQVSVLANSLAATHLSVVHAGYAKHRQALLRAGMRRDGLRNASGAPKLSLLTGFTGSSAASLHTKIHAMDGERLFVGLFNLIPARSSPTPSCGLSSRAPRWPARWPPRSITPCPSGLTSCASQKAAPSPGPNAPMASPPPTAASQALATAPAYGDPHSVDAAGRLAAVATGVNRRRAFFGVGSAVPLLPTRPPCHALSSMNPPSIPPFSPRLPGCTARCSAMCRLPWHGMRWWCSAWRATRL